ncbi:type II toxin-antitoxin system RelE family toxin [Geomesophilobacter sediminis]|uniref:Type II toxin-antitoxin system RelE/ParE family toxin n=1 Tax=Geomesophilobacter sediminis TaxID=2798584 RepID=A0A8J7M263_9BACT|nr:type II toxin-antitoxin system RelE/ParE family toxin [Geomesophilobacter sediminis]
MASNQGVGGSNPSGRASFTCKGDSWRYRVGDYRIICDIKDNMATVPVLRVRHDKG